MDSGDLLGKTTGFVNRLLGKTQVENPFPHCDPRFLHAPGECSYCDRFPHYQALRVAWGINFTGHNEEFTEDVRQQLEYLERGVVPPRGTWQTLSEFRNYVEESKKHRKMLPCPANYNRDQKSIDHWQGNQPTRIINEEM